MYHALPIAGPAPSLWHQKHTTCPWQLPISLTHLATWPSAKANPQTTLRSGEFLSRSTKQCISTEHELGSVCASCVERFSAPVMSGMLQPLAIALTDTWHSVLPHSLSCCAAWMVSMWRSLLCSSMHTSCTACTAMSCMQPTVSRYASCMPPPAASSAPHTIAQLSDVSHHVCCTQACNS